MAGGALRRGIVVATTVLAGVGLPAGVAVATDGHGDRGGHCHRCGGDDQGHRHSPGRVAHGSVEHGTVEPGRPWPWPWPDEGAGGEAGSVPTRPAAAVVLALIAAGFATRRGLSKVD